MTISRISECLNLEFSVFIDNPAVIATINNRYPPSVLGSPLSPSNGALTLIPAGI